MMLASRRRGPDTHPDTIILSLIVVKFAPVDLELELGYKLASWHVD